MVDTSNTNTATANSILLQFEDLRLNVDEFKGDIKSDIKRMEDKFIELSNTFDKLMDMFTRSAIADKDLTIDNEGLNTIKPKLS